MNTVFINLAHQTQRKLNIIKFWKPHLANLIRIPGTQANKITKEQLTVEKNPRVVACYLSHKRAFKLAQSKNEYTIILEDDSKPCSDIKERLETLKTYMEQMEWDLLLLGHWPIPNHLLMPVDFVNKQLSEAKLGNHLFKAERGIIGCHAYIINPKFYSEMEKIYQLEFNNMDEVFKYIQKHHQMICFLPALCYQQGNISDTSGDGVQTNSEEGSKTYYAETMQEWIKNNNSHN